MSEIHPTFTENTEQMYIQTRHALLVIFYVTKKDIKTFFNYRKTTYTDLQSCLFSQ